MACAAAAERTSSFPSLTKLPSISTALVRTSVPLPPKVPPPMMLLLMLTVPLVVRVVSMQVDHVIERKRCAGGYGDCRIVEDIHFDWS